MTTPGSVIGSAYIDIRSTTARFGSDLKGTEPVAQRQGAATGKKFGETFERTTNSRASAAGDKFGALFGRAVGGTLRKTIDVARTAAIGGLIATGVAGVAILKDSISQASDLSESLSKTRVVFGQASGSVEAFAKTASSGIGQSRQEALEATSTFGNLFEALGIGNTKAATLSTRIVKLAGDLASFNNTDPAEALEALKAGLLGEAEPLRKYGVTLSVARVQAEALADGIVRPVKDSGKVHSALLNVETATKKLSDTEKKHGEHSLETRKAQDALARSQVALTKATKGVVPTLTAAQTAQAAYNVIIKDTKTAQGDFGRTSSGLANQQRILTASFKDAEGSIGAALIPAATEIVPALTKAIHDVTPEVTRLATVGGKQLSTFITEFAKGEGTGGRVRKTLADVGSVIHDDVLPPLETAGHVISTAFGFVASHPTLFSQIAKDAVVIGAALKGVSVLKGLTGGGKGGGLLGGALGGVVASTRPIPVFVTNPGFRPPTPKPPKPGAGSAASAAATAGVHEGEQSAVRRLGGKTIGRIGAGVAAVGEAANLAADVIGAEIIEKQIASALAKGSQARVNSDFYKNVTATQARILDIVGTAGLNQKNPKVAFGTAGQRAFQDLGANGVVHASYKPAADLEFLEKYAVKTKEVQTAIAALKIDVAKQQVANGKSINIVGSSAAQLAKGTAATGAVVSKTLTRLPAEASDSRARILAHLSTVPKAAQTTGQSLKAEMQSDGTVAGRLLVGGLLKSQGAAGRAGRVLKAAAVSGAAGTRAAFAALGQQGAAGYAQGFRSERIQDSIAATIRAGIAAGAHAQDSHSPSRVYAKLGRDASTGYAQGIARNQAAASKAAFALVKRTAETAERASIAGSQRQIDALTARLQGVRDLRAAVSGSILSAGNITGLQGAAGAPTTAAGVITLLSQRSRAATQFSADLSRDAKLGLNRYTLRQMAEAGVDGGGPAAAALARATKAQIAQINRLAATDNATARRTGQSAEDLVFGKGAEATIVKQRAAAAKQMAAQNALLERIAVATERAPGALSYALTHAGAAAQSRARTSPPKTRARTP